MTCSIMYCLVSRDDGDDENSKNPKRGCKSTKYASPLSVYIRNTRKKLKSLNSLDLKFKDNNRMTPEESDTVRLFGTWMMKNLGTQYFFPTKSAPVNRLFKMVRDDQTSPVSTWRQQAMDYTAETLQLTEEMCTTLSTESRDINEGDDGHLDTNYESDD